MSAYREVRCYVCPDQLEFALALPVGAVIKDLIVRQQVEMCCLVDPEETETEERHFKVVREGESFLAGGLTWIGTVDYRHTYWFVGEDTSKS